MRAASGAFRLERKVEYGTPEQNETVARIVEAVRRKAMRRCCGIRSEFDGVRWMPARCASRTTRLQAAYAQVDAGFLDGAPAGGREYSRVSREAEAQFVDGRAAGRHDARPDHAAAEAGRRLRAGRQGGLSVLRADERHPGAGGGRAGDRDGDAAGDRRQGGHRPVYSGRGRGSGRQGDVPGRRRASGRRAGLRHGDDSRRR